MATTLGLRVPPRSSPDAESLTHLHRSGIDGLEAPLGPLDDRNDIWQQVLGFKILEIEHFAGWALRTGHADDTSDTVSERSNGENTININYE